MTRWIDHWHIIDEQYIPTYVELGLSDNIIYVNVKLNSADTDITIYKWIPIK